jgi:hypothetical protein
MSSRVGSLLFLSSRVVALAKTACFAGRTLGLLVVVFPLTRLYTAAYAETALALPMLGALGAVVVRCPLFLRQMGDAGKPPPPTLAEAAQVAAALLLAALYAARGGSVPALVLLVGGLLSLLLCAEDSLSLLFLMYLGFGLACMAVGAALLALGGAPVESLGRLAVRAGLAAVGAFLGVLFALLLCLLYGPLLALAELGSDHPRVGEEIERALLAAGAWLGGGAALGSLVPGEIAWRVAAACGALFLASSLAIRLTRVAFLRRVYAEREAGFLVKPRGEAEPPLEPAVWLGRRARYDGVLVYAVASPDGPYRGVMRRERLGGVPLSGGLPRLEWRFALAGVGAAALLFLATR